MFLVSLARQCDMKRLIIFFLLLVGSLASGDGLYASLHSPMIATEPYQRAIISQRDGEEVMVVESVLNAEPGEYAWIVPLPSAPTAYGMTDSRQLDRAFMRFSPRRNTYFEFAETFPAIVLIVFALLISGFAIAGKDLRLYVVLAVLFVILSLIFMPVFAGRTSATSSIQTLVNEQIGNYDVKVVQAHESAEMISWLRKHGAQLSTAAESCIAEHVKEHWCFLVANIRKTKIGSLAPHPLWVKFKAQKPIFPMRLTGQSNSTVLADLLVVAGGTATADGLYIWRSRQIESNSDRPLSRTKEDFEDEMSYLPLKAVAWNGCTVTRLRGMLQPNQMTKDVAFQVSKPADIARRAISSSGYATAKLGIGTLAGSVFGFIASIIVVLRRLPKNKRVLITSAVILVSGLLCGELKMWGYRQVEPGYYLDMTKDQ